MLNARDSMWGFLTLVLFSTSCSQPEAINRDQIIQEVRSSVEAHWTAIAESDFETVASHHSAEFAIILPDFAEPFVEGASEYDELLTTRASWTIGDVHVRPLSSDAAVAWFLMEGSTTWPDGRVDDRKRRVSEVWVREGGTWKEAHHHDSVYAPGESSDPLAGVWLVTTLTAPDGETIDPAGPGQFIFADGRYSAVYSLGAEERPHAAVGFNPTADEKVAQYDTIIVNSGTYEVDGSEFTLRPIIAKTPEYAGGSSTLEFHVDGNVLTTVTRSITSVDGASPDGAIESSMTLRRVQ